MITSGLEDYLELIYLKINSNQNVKAIDISNEFKISRASVSEALIRLADLELIIYEGRRGIKMTDKGIEVAKKIINKHKILSDFFNQIFGFDKELSNKNACKIEHVIDEEIIDNMENFLQFAQVNNLKEKFDTYKKNRK